MSQKIIVNDYNYEEYIGRISDLHEAIANFMINKNGKLSVYRKHFIANTLNKMSQYADSHMGY